MQYSEPIRNAKLDAIQSVIGPSPTLKFRTGPAPADCSKPDTGAVLATLVLPAVWMNPASGGVKTMSGNWAEPGADANGTPGHYRIYDSGGVCHNQGSVTIAGGGGDMTVSILVFVAGQGVRVVTFTLTAGNA